LPAVLLEVPPDVLPDVSPPAPTAPSRIFVVRAAAPEGYSEGPQSAEPRIRVSGHANRYKTNFGQAFAAAFRGALRKTGYSDNSDDAPVYRYGVAFRVQDLAQQAEAIKGLTEWLDTELPSNASAHIVVEDKALLVNVNFGNYHKGTTADIVIAALERRAALIKRAFEKAAEYTVAGDWEFEWFPYWDWDDDMEPY
jgi:hypothetical protein